MLEDRVDLWDVTLRVRRLGSGPPVLLLPGCGGIAQACAELAPALAEHHAVVCPDLREDRGDAWQPLLHEMALDALAVMLSFGHDRFAAVGIDVGGHVAARLAVEHPYEVERLVVIDAVPLPPPTCPTLVLWTGHRPVAEPALRFLG